MRRTSPITERDILAAATLLQNSAFANAIRSGTRQTVRDRILALFPGSYNQVYELLNNPSGVDALMLVLNETFPDRAALVGSALIEAGEHISPRMTGSFYREPNKAKRKPDEFGPFAHGVHRTPAQYMEFLLAIQGRTTSRDPRYREERKRFLAFLSQKENLKKMLSRSYHHVVDRVDLFMNNPTRRQVFKHEYKEGTYNFVIPISIYRDQEKLNVWLAAQARKSMPFRDLVTGKIRPPSSDPRLLVGISNARRIYDDYDPKTRFTGDPHKVKVGFGKYKDLTYGDLVGSRKYYYLAHMDQWDFKEWTDSRSYKAYKKLLDNPQIKGKVSEYFEVGDFKSSRDLQPYHRDHARFDKRLGKWTTQRAFYNPDTDKWEEGKEGMPELTWRDTPYSSGFAVSDSWGLEDMVRVVYDSYQLYHSSKRERYTGGRPIGYTKGGVESVAVRKRYRNMESKWDRPYDPEGSLSRKSADFLVGALGERPEYRFRGGKYRQIYKTPGLRGPETLASIIEEARTREYGEQIKRMDKVDDNYKRLMSVRERYKGNVAKDDYETLRNMTHDDFDTADGEDSYRDRIKNAQSRDELDKLRQEVNQEFPGTRDHPVMDSLRKSYRTQWNKLA